MYRYPVRMPPNYPIQTTGKLSQPKSKNSNIKVIAIVSLFALVAIVLMMVMLAGSNPLSHKTGFVNNNMSSSKPTSITTETTGNGSNDADGNKACFGSETVLHTSRGLIKLKYLEVGDKVMSWDKISNKTTMETIWYISDHGQDKIDHYRISLDSDEIVNLSPEHLIFLEDKTFLRAKELTKGQKILNINNESSTIINIENVEDVPLTPLTLTGNILLPNTSVVSCWSHDKENVDYITKLIEKMKPYTLKYTPQEMNLMIDRVYNSLDRKSKNTEEFNSVLSSLDIDIIKVK